MRLRHCKHWRFKKNGREFLLPGTYFSPALSIACEPGINVHVES